MTTRSLRNFAIDWSGDKRNAWRKMLIAVAKDGLLRGVKMAKLPSRLPTIYSTKFREITDFWTRRRMYCRGYSESQWPQSSRIDRLMAEAIR